jgi:SAM-dependent methyltransferase
LDIDEGPNVDIVPECCYIWNEIPDNEFDIVISGQAFEHIEFFWITFKEMVRVLAPGGLLCVIAPRGFVRHRFPVDCYRFDSDSMVALARYGNLEPLHVSTNLAPAGAPRGWYSPVNNDSMLVARKPPDWPGMLDVHGYSLEVPDLERLATGFVPDPLEKFYYFFLRIADTVYRILNKLFSLRDKPFSPD